VSTSVISSFDQVVTNTTCLIGLERIGRLAILPQVFPVIYAPPFVQTEIGLVANWLMIRSVQNLTLVTTLQTQVDAGEAEAIALALELQAVAILDDLQARKLAGRLGLQVIGTVRVLLLAKQQGVVSEIKPLLLALRDVGFRMTDSLMQTALKLAGEAEVGNE
jgi:predicted nucleic acid-binding protein